MKIEQANMNKKLTEFHTLQQQQGEKLAKANQQIESLAIVMGTHDEKFMSLQQTMQDMQKILKAFIQLGNTKTKSPEVHGRVHVDSESANLHDQAQTCVEQTDSIPVDTTISDGGQTRVEETKLSFTQPSGRMI